ncbi:MAG: ADP-ribosylation factor-like protein [Candidatus Hodarchaeota archaeon]
MTLQTSNDTQKIILLGLAESGKTSIIKVVKGGYIPSEKAPYTATLDYERENITLFGKTITFFDLGGQKAFLDRFMGELAKFIFSNVTMLIFIVDIVDISKLSLSKYYLDLAVDRLSQYSPDSSIYVFLHKIDLIDQNKMDDFCNNMKIYLSEDIEKSMTFFPTSIFSESIFQQFKDIITKVSEKPETIDAILDSFLNENSEILELIQIFTEDGVPLISTSNSAQVSTNEIRKLFDTALQQIYNKEETTTSVVLETENDINFVRFLNNKNVLFLSFSRTSIMTKNLSLPILYNNVASLTEKLNSFHTKFT